MQQEMIQIGLFEFAELPKEVPVETKNTITNKKIISPSIIETKKTPVLKTAKDFFNDPSKQNSLFDHPVQSNIQIENLETIPEGGSVSRARSNIAAIKIAKKYEQGITITTEEKALLVKYVGWGGLPQVFDLNKNLYNPELKEILTNDEYHLAKQSILNSHYTPQGVIKSMWKIATQMGFEKGEVAEFGAGIGHFVGMTPQKIQSNVNFTTVEIDKISSLILKALYPRATHHNAALENIEFKNQFDLVIGNVPFGQEKVYDKNYPNLNLHNYFIARSIDALKEDGVAILLTSAGTMDSQDTKARKYFTEKAKFVGAVRLPNTTFKKSAGTEVVSDILVFHKTSKSYNNNILEIKDYPTADNTGNAKINEYFSTNPHQVYGNISNTGRMYGNLGSTTVVNNSSSEEKQKMMYQNFPANVIDNTKPIFDLTTQEETEEVISAPEEKDYSIFEYKDNIYECLKGKGTLLRDKKGKTLSEKEKSKAKSFIKLKILLNKLLSEQLDERMNDEAVEATRRLFSQEYDLHVSKYGFINQKAVYRHLCDDPSYIKLAATENVKEITISTGKGKKKLSKKYSKSDIFFKRTQFPWKEPTSAENIVEAGLISNCYRHQISVEYVQKLMKIDTPENTRQQLVASGEYFENPTTKEIELKSKYLSGNVVRKLKTAEEAAVNNPKDYKRNVEALLSTQPKVLEIDKIDFKLGSYWLPAETIKNWIAEKLNANCEINYIEQTDKWEVKPSWEAKLQTTEYKVRTMNVFEIIECTLNLKDPIVKIPYFDENGVKKYKIDQEETLAARQIQQEMVDSYRAYILNNHNEALKVEKNYNLLFNNHIDRQYNLPVFNVYPNAVEYIDGEKFELREHQKRAVSRGIEGNALYAHCVGAGKTAVMLTVAMELKRLKLATKSLIVVQNATLEQFASFAPKLYPTAKILVAEKKDLVKAKRKRFLSKIATCDWDIVIIAQSSFDMLKNNPEIEQKHFEDQINELDLIVKILREEGKRCAMKDIVRMQKQLETKLKKLSDKANEENLVYFEELGIDSLFIDEAHAYKKNFFYTKKERIKGLDTSASQRSFSLSLKIKTIKEKTNGRNIYFATGTPVTNTLAELWNMVRYISPETLKEYNIETFDQFASTFTETETALEIDAAGRFKMVTRFSKYTNVAEMSKMFKSVADVVLSEDLKGVKRPGVKGGAAENISIARSENISTYMEYLTDLYKWYEGLGQGEKKNYCHIPLVIYGKSRKSTIDMRLIDPSFQDDPSSKVNMCVAKIFDKYREYDYNKGTQIVFCDLYKNTIDGIVCFNAWEEIKNKLTLKGIPSNEIAVISEFNTDKQRANLYKKVNSGEIRVVIGSTSRLGTGVNVQERLAVAHHIDAPFRPSDMEQRDGRVIRQGNTFGEVEIYRYGIEQTLDAGMYQILERKQKFINDAMKGRASRTIQELNNVAMDYATFSATISGNNKLKRKVVLETRIRELKALESQFYRSLRSNEYEIIRLQKEIPELKNDIETAEKLIKDTSNFSTDKITISLKGINYDCNEPEQAKALKQKIAQTGFYVAKAISKRTFQTESENLGIVAINGVRVNMEAIDDYRLEDCSKLRFVLEDYKFNFTNISNAGSFTAIQYFGTVMKNIFGKNKVEIANLKRIIASYEIKLQRLQIPQQSEFIHSEELKNSQTELKEIIFELDKEGKGTNNIKIENKPIVSDYFPELINPQITIQNSEEESIKIIEADAA